MLQGGVSTESQWIGVGIAFFILFFEINRATTTTTRTTTTATTTTTTTTSSTSRRKEYLKSQFAVLFLWFQKQR